MKLSRKLTEFLLLYGNIYFSKSVSGMRATWSFKEQCKKELSNQSKKTDMTETTLFNKQMRKYNLVISYWSASVLRGLMFQVFSPIYLHLRFVGSWVLLSAPTVLSRSFIPETNTAILLFQMCVVNTTHWGLSIRN